MLRTVEPCIRDERLYPLYSMYYDRVFLEGKGRLIKAERVTVQIKSEKELPRLRLEPHRITVVKPLSRSVVKRVLDQGFKVIRIDSDNFNVIRKGQLNLFRQYDVILEVPLNKVNYYILRTVCLYSTRYVSDVLISSCSSGVAEVWHPLSKLALLTSLGVPEADAFHFVFISPLRLLHLLEGS